MLASGALASATFATLSDLAMIGFASRLKQVQQTARDTLYLFGADHVLFGTDCPFDPQGGPLFIRETIKALDGLKLKPNDRRRIYFGNAMQMLKLKLPK